MWEPIEKFIKHFFIHAGIAVLYSPIIILILTIFGWALWWVFPISIMIAILIELKQWWFDDNKEPRLLDRFHDILGYVFGTGILYFIWRLLI